MAASMPRLERCLAMIQDLLAGPCRARDWMRSLGVSRSQIYKDLRLVRRVFPMESRGQEWRLLEAWSWPVPFDQSALHALLTAASLPLFQQSPSLGGPLARVRDQIVRHLRDQVGEQLGRRPADAIRLPTGTDLSLKSELFDRLEQAARERRVVLARYRPARRGARDHRLRPHALRYLSADWYCVAWMEGVERPLLFKVARFEEVALTADRFEPPEDFDLGAFLNTAWDRYPGEPVDVLVRVFPPKAHLFEEKARHPSQRIEPDPGSHCLLVRYRVALAPDFVGWLLSWGDNLEVLEPARLRAALRDLARNLSELYGSDEAPPPR